MKIYSSARPLYNDWEEDNKKKGVQIQELKKRRDKEKTDEEHNQIHWELQELLIQKNLIHHFLADLGPLVYREEEKNK